ncbi:MAG: DNA internalization-related competence protein ComEC/Rec2, partial [Methylococcaceae bacterium]|nr:DNA internalization-related competence protein ComEC/Rec2 [Methylococcaceae bacterium]
MKSYPPPFAIRTILVSVAGILAAQQFPFLPPAPAIGAIGALAIALWLSGLRTPAGFLFGLAWALGFAAVRLQDTLPAEWEGRDLLIEGRLMDLPQRLEKGLRFGFEPERVAEPAGVLLPHSLRLSWFDSSVLPQAGEHWRLRVRLKQPHGFFNPGGMDYELWLFSQGIRATGYVREDGENRRIAAASPYSLQTWRQILHHRLTEALAGSPMSGIIIALAMGAEDTIPPEQWEVFRRTGTAHLVAISGSHISLIAGLVFLLIHRSCALLGILRWPPPSVAALSAFAAAWFYSALSGFAIPTQRALIMIFVIMVGVIGQRQVRPLHTLAVALLAVALYDPSAVLAPGFWLSYTAVGLILLTVAGRLHAGGWWMQVWKINWATSLGLAPLLLLFFRQVSLISPLANLLAVPSIGFLLTPLCLVGMALLMIHPPLGKFVLGLTEAMLQWIWRLLERFSELPLAQWNHPAPPSWTLPFALVGAVLLLAPRGIPARWLGLVLMLPAFSSHTEPPNAGHFRLTLLDVGQALSAIVQTHHHVLVFDTGMQLSETFDTGSAVIEPFLRQQGLGKIDVLVVSHGDNDHIGGAASLFKHMPIEKTYSSVPGLLPMTLAQACREGQVWEWDGVKFEMLYPFGTVGNENDNSCVLKVG